MYGQEFINDDGIIMTYEDLEYEASELAEENGTDMTEELFKLMCEYRPYFGDDEDDDEDEDDFDLIWCSRCNSPQHIVPFISELYGPEIYMCPNCGQLYKWHDDGAITEYNPDENNFADSVELEFLTER